MRKLLLGLLFAVLVLPAFAQDKKHNFSVGFETSAYTYREPEPAVRWDGPMYGVAASYLGRGVMTVEEDESDNSFVSIEGRYMQGSVDYDGRLMTGEGIKENGIKDYFAEGRLLAGASYKIGDSGFELLPFLGVGYRYLYDNFGDTKYGYDRSSAYFYTPVGITAKYSTESKWSFSATAEYDIFWNGTQKSKMKNITGTVGPNTIYFNSTAKNKQDEGYGVRASVKAEKSFEPVGVFVEPFFRYWHVQNSDLSPIWDTTGNYAIYVMEPKNETTEWGLRVGLTF